MRSRHNATIDHKVPGKNSRRMLNASWTPKIPLPVRPDPVTRSHIPIQMPSRNPVFSESRDPGVPLSRPQNPPLNAPLDYPSKPCVHSSAALSHTLLPLARFAVLAPFGNAGLHMRVR